MPMKNKVDECKLNVIYNTEGFSIDMVDVSKTPNDNVLYREILDWKVRFNEDKYKALYLLGFLTKKDWFTPQLEYLYHIAELLIQKISKQPDMNCLEITL